MRARVVLLLALPLLLSACHDAGEPRAAPMPTPPTLGGAAPNDVPPATRMHRLEKPVAQRLDRQISSMGLHVDYLRCPTWSGSLPAEMTCAGWFDNVKAAVEVSLKPGLGGTVDFDAKLGEGIISTFNLRRELEARGYTAVDCGPHPAYSAVIGATITCAVTRAGKVTYVRAVVRSHAGKVTISDL